LIEFKLNRIESPARHSSSLQKAELTREILSSVARMSDPIRRSFLVRDLAERLHIDESGLWSEMSTMQVRSAPTNQVETEPAEGNDYFKSPKGAAELGLFKISLLHPNIIPMILVNVNVEDIEHQEIRSFFTHFKKYPAEVENFAVKDYISSVRDQMLAGQISFWLQENIVQLKHEEFARQCLITFQVEKIEAQQRLIRQEMSAAHSQQASAELMDRMHKYLLERQKASRGEFIVGLPPPKQVKG
jgi:DNA primase